MAQSRSDLSGMSHSHGWGVATYENGMPEIERQAWAAYHGEHFRRKAAHTFAELVIAHVRRATVGEASHENTHPFAHGRWTFAHNGTVPRFEEVKDRLLPAIAPHFRREIKGETDSEHVFYYALTIIEQEGDEDLQEIVRRIVLDVRNWVREIDAHAPLGLNVMLTDGERLAGSRLGRTLQYISRDGVYDCEICGFPHIHHEPNRDYRAFVVASEPLTHEDWTDIPEASVWSIGPDRDALLISPL